MIDIANLLVTKITVGGIWASVFNFFTDIIPSYGWVMIVITILIKLLLSPFEYFQKAPNIEQMKKRQLLQPEI